MKKIVLYICLCFVVGCSGYKPLFSLKNVNFYIQDIENLNGDRISNKIITGLKRFSEIRDSKNIYILKISSKKTDIVASKDSKGNPSVYKVSIITTVNVILDGKSINKIYLQESFNYNNTSNKFDLNQYKKNIQNNLVDKITERLILRLQNL